MISEDNKKYYGDATRKIFTLPIGVMIAPLMGAIFVLGSDDIAIVFIRIHC